MSALDASLQAMRGAWDATARYRVYRNEAIGAPNRVINPGPLTWLEARALQEKLELELENEPGYRRYVMNRPVIGIELITAPAAPRVCACGCGAVVTGRAILASAACRKREQRRRHRARSSAVTTA